MSLDALAADIRARAEGRARFVFALLSLVRLLGIPGILQRLESLLRNLAPAIRRFGPFGDLPLSWDAQRVLLG